MPKGKQKGKPVEQAPADSGAVEAEVVEPQAVQVVAAESLEPLMRAEIDVAIATANRYPRKLSQARERILEMATATQEIAEGCFYALPRGGKIISGESVRLAEIARSAYGNIRAGARGLEVGEKHVVAQGAVHDLENNNYGTSEVRRRIVDKHGKRYSDDMVIMTMNAACQIALRNATWQVIPKSLFAAEFRRIREVSAGDEQTMTERLTALVEWYGQRGADEKQVCALVGKRALGDVTLEDLALLRDVANAIKDNEALAEDIFGAPEGLASKLAAGKHKVGKGKAKPPKDKGQQTPDSGPTEAKENAELALELQRLETAHPRLYDSCALSFDLDETPVDDMTPAQQAGLINAINAELAAAEKGK